MPVAGRRQAGQECRVRLEGVVRLRRFGLYTREHRRHCGLIRRPFYLVVPHRHLVQVPLGTKERDMAHGASLPHDHLDRGHAADHKLPTFQHFQLKPLGLRSLGQLLHHGIGDFGKG